MLTAPQKSGDTGEGSCTVLDVGVGVKEVEAVGAKKKSEAFSIGPVQVISHLNLKTGLYDPLKSVGALFSVGKISPF